MPPVAEAAAATSAAEPANALGDGLVGDAAPTNTTTRDGHMRRVASAPAFKHASCYQEVSPTAAVAAAVAVAAVCPPPSGSRRQQQRTAARVRHAQQPCSSCSGGRCNCLEVYVVSRSFTEFAGPVMRRMHPDVRERMVEMGICHYMTVFKTADGELVQFDFGPLGGDVQKAHGPLATFLRRARAAAQQQQQQQQTLAAATAIASSSSSSGDQTGADTSSSSSSRGMVHSPSAPSLPLASLDLALREAGGEPMLLQDHSSSSRSINRPKRGVAGEIRERTLQELPPACMYMGRTSLSLDDIRQYNAAQGRQTYTLHEHDCRHYVNSLVQYTTGVERSTQHLKRHYFSSRHADRWLWYGWLISASQLVTDVGNWSHIQAGAAVTLLAVTGRSTLASLKTLATPMLPALKGLPALLPSAGLTAAAAGAAAAPGGGAAAGSAGGAAMTLGALGTTLKLPATLLLRRPLAAGAAAGSAGAAAAAMRDTTGTSAAAAAGSSGGSSGSSGGMAKGAWRPLQRIGDGMAHGCRTALLGLRRLALGNTQALQQLQQQQPQRLLQQPVAASAAASSAPPARRFWGRVSSSSGQQDGRTSWFRSRPRNTASSSGSNQLQLVRQPSSSNMLASPVATAAAETGQDQQQQPMMMMSQQQDRRRPLMTLGHHVGRQVLGLGSAAARASGQLALFAFGGGRAMQQAPAAAAAAAAGSSRGALVQSASSHQLQQQQQQLQAPGFGHAPRSLSMPSLLAMSPDAAARPAAAAASSSAAVVQCSPAGPSGLGSPDLTFMWDSAGSGSSSSLSCGAAGGGAKSPGAGGRQVLNLPAPRISWGRRATQAIIVRQ